MRLIDADLFMQRIESYNTLDEMDQALYNFALHEIVCMPTVDVFEQIRDEVNKLEKVSDGNKVYVGINDVFDIIDKYKGDKA